jgi:hypothetical protein
MNGTLNGIMLEKLIRLLHAERGHWPGQVWKVVQCEVYKCQPMHSTRISSWFADIGKGCIFPSKKNVFNAVSASLRTVFDHHNGGDVALLVLMLHCW